MTRLTIAASGDNQTFAPVSSSLSRVTKDGKLNVVIMFFGTDYNISMNGILQASNSGNVILDTISVANSKLQIEARSTDGLPATKTGSYTSFMYFYPKLKIRGHLELSESSDATMPIPKLEGNYKFTDLVTRNILKLNLKREVNNLVFELITIVDDVETIVHSEALAPGILEYDFEFRYLETGKSKLYNIVYDNQGLMTFTRLFIGDLGFNPAECSVSASITNESNTILKFMKSDRIFLKYPNIYLGYDPIDSNDYYLGQIFVFDTINSQDEADWIRVISRDYKFIGDRVFENGILRIIITTVNPIIQLYGWNFEADTPSWELAGYIQPLSDDLDTSLKLQSVLINHINVNQIKMKVNFGSTIYTIRMSRGSPFINIFSAFSKNIKVVVVADRFIGDFLATNPYDLTRSFTEGNPEIRAIEEEDIVINPNTDMNDNYWSWYTPTSDNEVVGWLSNFIQPSNINIKDTNEGMEFLFTYANSANILGFGVLIGNPSNVVNNVPQPYAIGNIDGYVKWRANEAMVAFRQDNFLRRRV